MMGEKGTENLGATNAADEKTENSISPEEKVASEDSRPLFLRMRETKDDEIKDIQNEILKVKREKNALILSHNYMLSEIQEISDFVGDSFELAVKAAESPNELIVLCGVYFMAEGVKIISPEKNVLIPRLEAGCFLADMIDPFELIKFKQEHSGAPVVCYINTDAVVKAESDICCTSSNAIQIVQSLNSDRIIFIPDRNLGLYLQRFASKRLILWNGWCNVHHRFKAKDIIDIRKKHPDAVVIVHPECSPEVIDVADEVLSTGGMVRFARETKSKKLAIATEEGLLDRIRKENPDKMILSVGGPKLCVNMKSIRIPDVLAALEHERYKVEVPEKIIERARIPIMRMLEVTKGKDFVNRILSGQTN